MFSSFHPIVNVQRPISRDSSTIIFSYFRTSCQTLSLPPPPSSYFTIVLELSFYILTSIVKLHTLTSIVDHYTLLPSPIADLHNGS
jgi:hypothetical protein